MKNTRDNQRSKLYRAEREALSGRGAKFNDMDEVRQYVDEVCATGYWEKLNGKPVVGIADGRGRRRACAYSRTRIALPRWARQEYIILHELAHTVTNFHWSKPVADHGREFAKTYLHMVKRFMGHDHYLLLKESFKRNHVHYTAVAEKS